MCHTLNLDIEAVIPGMIANLLLTLGSHYLLRQPGGWVGIKDDTDVRVIRLKRKKQLNSILCSIKFFNLKTFCEKNSPKYESVYTLFAVFSLISVFSTFYSISHENRQQHKEILEIIYHSVLIISTVFLTYPIWPSTLKNKNLINFSWSLALPYTLIFVPTILIEISNFGQFQLMIFIVNLIILATLIRWQIALPSIFVTVALGISFYKWFVIPTYQVPVEFTLSLQFKIMYALILISSILMVFLKPKQEYQELTEEQNNHLQVMIKDREEELGKAQELKHEFLRNLEHEVNTPLVGLTSLAPMVLEDFDRLSPAQMKKYVKTIVDSHERYKTLSDNLLDLSKLDSLKYKLNKVKLNLSELIKSRLDYCRKLYLGNKELEFAMDVDPDVVIECDEHYIASLLDNLIINAIKYSKEGKITLKLYGNPPICSRGNK